MWTRNAILTETIEVVQAEDDPAYNHASVVALSPSSSPTKSVKSNLSSSKPQPQSDSTTQPPPSLLGKNLPSSPTPTASTIISVSPTATKRMSLPGHVPTVPPGLDSQSKGAANVDTGSNGTSSASARQSVGSSLKQRLQHAVGGE